MTYRGMLLGVLLLASCGAIDTGPKESGTDRIDTSYAVGGGEFDSGPKLFILARLRNTAGRTELCGAWTQEARDAKSALASENVLDTARIEHGGTTLFRGAGRFPFVRYSQNVSGGAARCFLLDVPWSPAFGEVLPTIVLTRYSSTSSRTVRASFRPGPVPRIVQPVQSQIVPVNPDVQRPGQWKRASE